MNKIFYYIVVLLCFLILPASAQYSFNKNKSKYNLIIGDKPAKWILGVKVGINRTGISVGDRFSVLERSYGGELYQKNYSTKNKLAPQISFITTFLPFKNIGITFQPAFFNYKYGYSNQYSWMNQESSAPYYQMKLQFNNTLNYLELPLMAKYYLINGDILAFVQGGAFYGRLINAKKAIEAKGIDNPGIGEVVSEYSTESMDVNSSYIKSYKGLIVGGGVGFKADNFRFALEVNYRKGLNNVIDEKNRFSNNQLVNSYYDVPDNLSFKNWEASISCSLPIDNLVHVSKKSDKSKSGKRF